LANVYKLTIINSPTFHHTNNPLPTLRILKPSPLNPSQVHKPLEIKQRSLFEMLVPKKSIVSKREPKQHNDLTEYLQQRVWNLVLIRMFEIWNHQGFTISELQRELRLTEKGQDWMINQLNLLHLEQTIEIKAGQCFVKDKAQLEKKLEKRHRLLKIGILRTKERTKQYSTT